MSGLTSALASLTATYTDSEDEDGTLENRNDVETELEPMSNPGSPGLTQSQQEATSKDSLASSVSNELHKTTSSSGLVSYFDDQIDDDAVDDYQSDSVSEKDEELKGKTGQIGTSGDDDSKSPEVIVVSENVEEEMIVEEIDTSRLALPPEPPGQPKAELQERVCKLYATKLKTGLDMNVYIQKNKQFRNPSIYEKLIKHCNIDELGTNYAAEIYNPHGWAESSFYDELAKVQKADMERREKEKKERTKVEFISGTVKKPSGSSTAAVPTGGAAGATTVSISDAEKRRSKWDQRGSVPTLPLGFASNQPILVQPNIATAVTGTKSTVINAFGNLPKKSKQ